MIKRNITPDRITRFLEVIELCKNSRNADVEVQYENNKTAKKYMNNLPKWAADEYKRQLRHMAVLERNKGYSGIANMGKMEYISRKIERMFDDLIQELSITIELNYTTEANIETKISEALDKVDEEIFGTTIPGFYSFTIKKLLDYFRLTNKEKNTNTLLKEAAA